MNQKISNHSKYLTCFFVSICKGHSTVKTFFMTLNIQCMDKKAFFKCLNDLAGENAPIKNRFWNFHKTWCDRHIYIERNLLDASDDTSILDVNVSYDGKSEKRGPRVFV